MHPESTEINADNFEECHMRYKNCFIQTRARTRTSTWTWTKVFALMIARELVFWKQEIRRRIMAQ